MESVKKLIKIQKSLHLTDKEFAKTLNISRQLWSINRRTKKLNIPGWMPVLANAYPEIFETLVREDIQAQK
jgi:hypothetical protein